ncbi:hypothetical protein FSP39_006361 [Pinctada imbricata]|uniref:EF-hand domain-containing protein n=1 Tax=Pinctada imbricata TaxID=66713 RepID=A0AA88XSQ8_PINIB|nr:hypothetical protein FSP39_006361 [Pinctada imbricata]
MSAAKAEYLGSSNFPTTQPFKGRIRESLSLDGTSTATLTSSPIPSISIQKAPVEDDQETVLDISVPIINYDDTGQKTYERACKKYGTVPSSKLLTKLGEEKEIDIKYYGLGPIGTRAICVALVINNNITKVNIRGNNIDKQGILYIQKMMSENMSITELDISENKLGSYGAKCVGWMLQDNKYIKRISLSANEFTDLDAHFFLKQIEEHPTLEYVDLSRNFFGDIAAPQFESMISENQQILDLDLSWNEFRVPGAKHLADGLKENMKLKRFNVSWNGLDDGGAKAFGDCIAHNAVLKELDVTCTRIGAVGFVSIINGLCKNEDLDVIRIGKNNLLEEYVKAAFLPLMELQSLKLTLLDLSEVMLSEEFVKADIEPLKEKFPELEIIHGYTDSYGKRKMAGFADQGEDALWTIKEYIERQNLTVAQLFAKFDEDGSNSVDYDEFRQGIKEAKIPLTSNQVDSLIKYIDIDGDGDIDFSELVLKMKEITHKRKEEEEQRKMDESKKRTY